MQIWPEVASARTCGSTVRGNSTRRSRAMARLFVGACLILQGGAAEPYNISLKGRVHERLTRLAELCLERSAGLLPRTCDVTSIAWGRTMGNWRNDLTLSSRWADDPTRQIGGLSGIKFAINAGRTCEGWFDEGRDPSRAPYGGILCSTHYGPLQFWHAMRSSEAEPASETRAKMLEWIDVAYRVATGRIPSSEEYCTFFRNRPAIARAMVPENFRYCTHRPGPANNGNGYPAWRVHTLFSMRCSDPITSTVCSEATGAGGVTLARRNAQGALLHLIQDSFSQSHVARGSAPTGRRFTPRIVCAPAAAFFFYNGQLNSGVDHGSADKYPSVDTATCQNGGEIDDPVTASAVMLWHIRANSDPEIVQAYFRGRVLGPSA